EVVDLRRPRAGVVVRDVPDPPVRDRQLQPIAERAKIRVAELLRLVGDVPGLDGGAQPEALDREREDHGGPAAVLDGGAIRGVELAGVMTATAKGFELGVAQVLHEAPQPGPGAEQVLADVATIARRQRLELAVEEAPQARRQESVRV